MAPKTKRTSTGGCVTAHVRVRVAVTSTAGVHPGLELRLLFTGEDTLSLRGRARIEPGPLVPLCLEYQVGLGEGRAHCRVCGAETQQRQGAQAIPPAATLLSPDEARGPGRVCTSWWGTEAQECTGGREGPSGVQPLARSRAGRSGPIALHLRGEWAPAQGPGCANTISCLREGGTPFPLRLPR